MGPRRIAAHACFIDARPGRGRRVRGGVRSSFRHGRRAGSRPSPRLPSPRRRSRPAVVRSQRPARPPRKSPRPKKPVPPPPPPPPPPVELIGYVIMPPGAFRAGPPSGQYDGDGRRAATPRFDSQPVQGVSSIKPGPTAGAWWALSDNGFGRKWNSPDYRLCVYLFDVRPRTEAGTDSRTALQAVVELSDPAKFFPWRLTDESDPGAPAHRRGRRSRVAGGHARRHFLDGRRARAVAAAFLDRRRPARSAGGAARQRALARPSAGAGAAAHRPRWRARAATRPWISPATTRRW